MQVELFFFRAIYELSSSVCNCAGEWTMDLPNRDKEDWALVRGLLEKSLSGGLPEIIKSTTELSGERIPCTICTLFITFSATIGN